MAADLRALGGRDAYSDGTRGGREGRAVKRYDLVVVGAGPAGMAAAASAARAGLRVALFDEGLQPGGQYHCRPGPGWADGLASPDAPAAVRRFLAANVEYHPRSIVWGIYGRRLLAVCQGETSDLVEAEQLVAATGARERTVAFPGWTLPGVLMAGGALALAKGQRIPPARRVVVAGCGPFLLPVARELLRVGAIIQGVYDVTLRREWLPLLRRAWRQPWVLGDALGYYGSLLGARVPLEHGWVITAARGEGRVEEVVLARADDAWRPQPGSERTLATDAICLGYGFVPATELTRLLGCDHGFDATADGPACLHDERMETSVPGVYVAGEAAGIGGARVAALQGEIAGIAAARKAGAISAPAAAARLARLQRRLQRMQPFVAALSRLAAPRPGLFQLATEETVICRCEEITLGEFRRARPSWPASANLMKLRTRTGMGMCQGRVCASLIAHLLPGTEPQHSEVFRVRPPIKPVPIRAILDIPPASLIAEQAPRHSGGPFNRQDATEEQDAKAARG